MFSKRRKRNKSNLFGGGLLLLSSLSLVSIGFSTWTISGGNANANIEVTADDIASNVISITNSYSNFTISQDGLIVDGTFVSSGKIAFDFSINNSYAKNYLWDDNKFHSTVTLTCTKNTDFMALVNNTPTSDNSSVSITNNSAKSSSASYSAKLSISLSSDAYTIFSLSYVVNSKTSDSKTYIKSFYSNSKLPSFNCSAIMESKA